MPSSMSSRIVILLLFIGVIFTGCDVRAPRERPSSDLNPSYLFPKEEFVKVVFRREKSEFKNGVDLLPAHVADLEVALHWQAETLNSLDGHLAARDCAEAPDLVDTYLFVAADERLVGKISRFNGCSYLWLWPDQVWMRLNGAGEERLQRITDEISWGNAYRTQ